MCVVFVLLLLVLDQRLFDFGSLPSCSHHQFDANEWTYNLNPIRCSYFCSFLILLFRRLRSNCFSSNIKWIWGFTPFVVLLTGESKNATLFIYALTVHYYEYSRRFFVGLHSLDIGCSPTSNILCPLRW